MPVPVRVVFIANLARAAAVEAAALAPLVELTEYETRLALAAPPPAILLVTRGPDGERRAEDVVATLRARGHVAHAFDDAAFTPSERMTPFDDFTLAVDGVRRSLDGAFLPFGDVLAILRAVHDRSTTHVRTAASPVRGAPLDVVTRVDDREHVAYFFRRSGERPWLLRERHASYAGLAVRGASGLPSRPPSPTAHENFIRTLAIVRDASPMAVADDRLVRRRAADRVDILGVESSTERGIDLLAHLLAMAIASQGGSPYR